MNKPTITRLFLYSDGSIEIKITEDKDQVTTITLTSEKMKGLDMDQRYDAAKKRAQSYIACVEKENQVVAGPFNEPVPFPAATEDQWKEAIKEMDEQFNIKDINTQARTEVMAQSELS